MNGRMQSGGRYRGVDECVNASREGWMSGRMEMGVMDDWRSVKKRIKGKQKGAIKSSVWRGAIEGKRWKERKS